MLTVTATGLGKFYGKKKVFRNLHFTISEPGCIGILGPNGSGKSTLMRCLSGLLRPSEGTLNWTESGVKIDPKKIRYRIGFAAPSIQLYRELTVAENLSFVRDIRPAGSGSPQSPDNLPEILETAGLTHLSRQEYGTLSSGQQQRVKLAAALIAQPDILMLDEPGTNLDENGRQLVNQIIHAHSGKSKFLFLASSKEDELALCDEKIVLH